MDGKKLKMEEEKWTGREKVKGGEKGEGRKNNCKEEGIIIVVKTAVVEEWEGGKQS